MGVIKSQKYSGQPACAITNFCDLQKLRFHHFSKKDSILYKPNSCRALKMYVNSDKMGTQ